MNKRRFLLFSMILGVSFLFPISPIPVQFFPNSYMPVIEIEVDGRKYFLELDSGCTGDITLRKDVLNDIQNKEYRGVAKTYDAKGNSYEESEFIIPCITIEDLEFTGVIVREESPQFFEKGCVFYESQNNTKRKDLRIAGRIGWGILKRHQWYFDLFHSLLWKVDKVDELMEISYFSPYDYVVVPFETGDAGIILSIDTNLGVKRFVLDTGASFPGLRQSIVEKRRAKEVEPGMWIYWSKVVVGGAHFGHYPFALCDFTSMIDVDGVMSIQFFEKNGIYLDFENKRAFIGPAKQSFWPRLIGRIKGLARWLFI